MPVLTSSMTVGSRSTKTAPGDVLAGTGLGEEGVEGVVFAPDSLVGGHLAVGMDAVLEAVELPAGVAHLAPGLCWSGRRRSLGTRR